MVVSMILIAKTYHLVRLEIVMDTSITKPGFHTNLTPIARLLPEDGGYSALQMNHYTHQDLSLSQGSQRVSEARFLMWGRCCNS